jgi:hypothetical protein
MSGYAVTARIVRASPRIAGGAEPLAVPGVALAAGDDASPQLAETRVDPGRLEERWGRLRVRVSQLTFYLTDPNSWR